MVWVHREQRENLPKVDAAAESPLLLISCLLTFLVIPSLKNERTISILSGFLPSLVSVVVGYPYVHMCEGEVFQQLRFDKVLLPLPSTGFLPPLI